MWVHHINTLFFYNEVVTPPTIEKTKITKQELNLAKNLINQMSDQFSPEKYKDEYNAKLLKAIKRKIAGNEIIEAKEDKEPTQIINLMDALQKSISTNARRA